MESDAALAEKLRIDNLRRSGIRVDSEGRFIHEGEPVRHEGLRQALFRWLDRLPDGQYILRLDEKRFAYLDVDDTPLLVGALRFTDDTHVTLALSDGAAEELDPATLTVDAAGVMRCAVRGGRLEARLTTSAAATLSEAIIEMPAGPALRLGPRTFVLRPRGSSARG
ncbi:MAG TPA: hypothetical protein VH374_08255 [Polyangia bacterium]|jgi:hypothetical protein|nr:hypothetical protein [Polyangia bacterium]